MKMGLESSTPELNITDGQVNLLKHVDTTHSDVSVSLGVDMDHPDSNGQMLKVRHDISWF